MTVAVATDNVRINDDIKLFSQALSEDGEMKDELRRPMMLLVSAIKK
ncbi:MAG TPA: hypothetical protein GX707_00345 [Epulopiscium sp.]|nr:hypothetical protein [Candidatus Epulonipiscium sp.]